MPQQMLKLENAMGWWREGTSSANADLTLRIRCRERLASLSLDLPDLHDSHSYIAIQSTRQTPGNDCPPEALRETKEGNAQG